MGAEQFSTPVRGASGDAVSVAASGTIETDNYEHGDAFDFDGSAYPYEINPAAVIEEIVITTAGDVVAEITTVGGDTVPLALAGGSGAFDKWSTDKITFRDPNGTGSRIAGGWAGE